MHRLWPLVVACSSAATPGPGAPVEPRPVATAACASTRIGGWDGSPVCAQAANTLIAGSDRTCARDTDCIRLGPHCAPIALRSDRSDAYQVTPCVSPEGGQCPPPCASVCRAGCCVIPEGWGADCR